MNTETPYRIELNGEPAHAEDIRGLVQTNYGHFTSMQVREGRVRGLGLHLDRLVASTRALFGSELNRDKIRDCLRHAIGTDDRPQSLRVNIFSRALDRERLNLSVPADILVIVGPASKPSTAPLRLKSFRYQRDLPSIKHIGTFPLFHYRRLAQQAGFDDAVFVDDDGCISEGSVWNIGFVELDRSGGDDVIWPDAPQLRGISMQLLQAGLARRGVSSMTRSIPLQDIARFRAAFFTNSSAPVRPIASIDDIGFKVEDALTNMLAECHDSNPWEPV
jgi:branched-subunit amino acid aminotransferase/4-amino-4-deoxychorismate lyase